MRYRYRMSRRGFKARPKEQTHNKMPDRPSVCDGCGESILPEQPILYDSRLPILTEITRSNGEVFQHQRHGAYHSFHCKMLRRHQILGMAMERERGKPHP